MIITKKLQVVHRREKDSIPRPFIVNKNLEDDTMVSFIAFVRFIVLRSKDLRQIQLAKDYIKYVHNQRIITPES